MAHSSFVQLVKLKNFSVICRFVLEGVGGTPLPIPRFQPLELFLFLTIYIVFVGECKAWYLYQATSKSEPAICGSTWAMVHPDGKEYGDSAAALPTVLPVDAAEDCRAFTGWCNWTIS